MTEPGDVTLRTYEAAAARYREQTAHPSPAIVDWLARVAGLAGPGAQVLELGSGPGHGARLLEQHGARVVRTDATVAFVEMLRADGYEAQVLDVRTGDLGGLYDAVLADAVLLHLTRDDFAAALRRIRAAVRPGGLLAITLKEGDGEAWRTDKLDLPRYFVYWREPALREALAGAGWAPLSIDQVAGREPWLFVVAGTA